MSSSTETAGRCPFGHGAEAPTGHHGYEPFQMKDPFPAYAELRAEQQQLISQIGEARSPAVIEKRAKSTLGLVAMPPSAVTSIGKMPRR